MIKENPYMPIEARLEELIEETPTIKTLVLAPKEPIEFRAGQFMQLTYPGIGEAPFTPSSNPNQPQRQEFTILKVGKVTDKLHDVRPGETLGLRGAFGKGYPIDKFYGKEILLVGGGVGLAPLRALMYALFNEIDKFPRISIKYGARSPNELLFAGQYKKWRSMAKVDFTETVDAPVNSWQGNVGVVTTLLDNIDIDIKNAYVVSCGPPVMLKFVTQKCLGLGFTPSQIYLSMNRKMSCGIGVCGRCNIGPYYLCKDGPDMCYEKIMKYDNVF
ncbi:MAG: FAD/NAD(P)-binding protein [Sedimentisphaerales bacterium]|nr:FAD/NAD(P)-binding protein [Sedimentisphaerales bacterium]